MLKVFSSFNKASLNILLVTSLELSEPCLALQSLFLNIIDLTAHRLGNGAAGSLLLDESSRNMRGKLQLVQGLCRPQ